ncbi:MAG: 3-oxoacyl-ACP synthase [Nitrosomonas sp.]|uniref:beta-ketoacyl synthase chain length factor n=1 Tax=Nitrosomonas sp. TaxID=42353 RepID=UPI0032EC75A1
MKGGADFSEDRLQCHVLSIGLLGPGLPDWNVAQSILSGEQKYQRADFEIPAVTSLPPTERRRVGKMVRLALTVGNAAVKGAAIDANQLATVFTSSSGDGDNCDAIFTTLAHTEKSERFISPTRFHNSVHNAPAGYWSIANQCALPSTSLCAYDASFAVGLMEACSQALWTGEPILLISSDVMYPYPLSDVRPMGSNFAVAMVLNAAANDAALAKLTLRYATELETRMEMREFDELRLSNPSARCLPLLQVIARKALHSYRAVPRQIHLEYVEPLTLEVVVD